ncbi:MAG TPA: hydroxyacid dehydrogenase [Clostridiales bacterium]|nr:hydroxyacid dehydrogenase [Clostridiales bacterium]
MKIAVLDRRALGEDLSLAPLERFGEVIVYPTTSEEELPARVADAYIVLINKVRFGRAAFDAAKKLRLICEFATGYDNISLEDARTHGVAVVNVPAYSTESVALFTFATVLSLMTHLSEYRAYVADGRYTASGVPNLLSPAYHELAGKTWGIVGCGNIGGRVAAIAEAFGAKVIVNRRREDPRFCCVDIETLCRESDILTLHCPLNEGTRHLLNAERIGMMKRSAILVNEARGAVVDSEAVACAIEEGRLGAFGSDVYDGEPLRSEDPLYRIRERENVILTPHAAWGAYEARERCLEIVCENIRAFFDGEIKNRVDI